MKSSKNYGIHFTLRLEKEKDGKAPIYMAITVNGTKVLLTTPQKITVKSWDTSKGLGKFSSVEGKLVNNYLEELRQSVGDCYKDLQLRRQIITAETLKKAFLRNGDDEHTLEELVSYHNETSKGVLADGTLKNYFTTKKYLDKFLAAHLKRSEYYLSELNYKFIKDFEVFLRIHKPLDEHKPLNNNGIMKHLERFRKMVNLAYRLEWIIRDPFEKYQLKFKQVEKEFLTSAELRLLETKNISVKRLAVVRDMFVFSCYTGLAFVDVMNLRPTNLVLGEDGKVWIKTFRQKTTVPVNVPVLKQPERIIEDYRENIKSLASGTIFPKISNQKTNSYLKELADICGVTKTLTFHVARHTFATSVTLVNGVPMETVSKLLGHTTIRSTQIYARVLEKKVSEDMAELQRKLG